MKRAAIVLALLVAGCANYRSEFITPENARPLSSYKYVALDPNNQKLRVINADAVWVFKSMDQPLIDYMIYHGFEVVPMEVPDDKADGALVAQWRETARRPDSSGGFSIEVTLLTDYKSKQVVYQGIGEAIGLTQGQDYRMALRNAMVGVEAALAGEKRGPASVGDRWKPIKQ